MDSKSLPLTKDGSVDTNAWLAQFSSISKVKPDQIRDVIELARIIGEDKANSYGFSCFVQGLESAMILANIGIDADAISAAILYGCVQHADLSLDDVEESAGKSVKDLIVGAQQMETVHLTHGRLMQTAEHSASIDNLRKMLLAMVKDVRVVMIKLAERLCVLKYVANFNEAERKRLANETMVIYAPLANRLGVWHLKWQLEDYAFRYLEHEKYDSLYKVISIHGGHKENFIAKAIGELREILQLEGIENAEISGRAKHIYSIYNKMKRKNVGLNKIYDIVALRILVPTIEDCYTALGAVNSHWSPIKEEFDDYISKPKSNGYQSLHTAVTDNDGNYLEIQIRTHDMHNFAELGVAAHWMYKEGKKKKEAGFEAKIAWLRQLMDWQKEISSQDKKEEEAYSHIFDDRIYVFTPKGEVIDLPKGATVLDFAYYIHSDVGNRCRGAKINQKMVPLKHQLEMGDKVEVLTVKSHTPSRDWLIPDRGYLFTSRARAKVNHWFRQQGYDKQVAIGEELFEREYKRSGLKETISDAALSHFNYKSKADLMAALGRGDLRIGTILHYIAEGDSPKKKAVKKKTSVKKKVSKASSDIVIAGMGNLLTQIAKCCKPLPGDRIVGYVTLGKGVSIHRSTCANLKANKKVNPDRMVDAKWGNANQTDYVVVLHMLVQPKKDIARNVTNCINDAGANILGLNASARKKDELTKINASVEIDSVDAMNNLLNKLRHLPGVEEVKRS